MGVCFMLVILKQFFLPNLKVASILLCLAFVYGATAPPACRTDRAAALCCCTEKHLAAMTAATHARAARAPNPTAPCPPCRRRVVGVPAAHRHRRRLSHD